MIQREAFNILKDPSINGYQKTVMYSMNLVQKQKAEASNLTISGQMLNNKTYKSIRKKSKT